MKKVLFFSLLGLLFTAACKKDNPQPSDEIIKNCTEMFEVDSTGSGVSAFGVALTPASLWQPGQTLRIRFIGGTSFVQGKVRQFAEQWLSYANIKFDWVTSGSAEIRISFANSGSWSYVGKQALAIAQNQATMNFGWFDNNTSDTEFQRTTVHEFGHALGLKHEHQHPQNIIPWDVPAVYSYYGTTQGWTHTQVDEQILNRYLTTITQFSAYCPMSIMHYPIPNQLTLGNFEVGWNTELATCDKDFIGLLYPIPNSPIELENEYLVGDWDGNGTTTLAARRNERILMNQTFDDSHDWLQAFGVGNLEDEYLIGDWDGDGHDNIAVRRGNVIHMDFNFDNTADFFQTFGTGSLEDQYLVGDWDGDGRDNIAVRRGNVIHMDFNFDNTADYFQTFGTINMEDEYLVGDWDGDGRDNIAVRRGDVIHMDFNFDDTADFFQTIGNASNEEEYIVGDWDGDGRSNIGIRRNNNQFHLDVNFDGEFDIISAYGNGTH